MVQKINPEESRINLKSKFLKGEIEMVVRKRRRVKKKYATRRKTRRSGSRARVRATSGLFTPNAMAASPAKKRRVKRSATVKRMHPSMAAVINPFQMITTQPKVPDGKGSGSVGQTYRDTFELRDGRASYTELFIVPALGYVCFAKFDELSEDITTNVHLRTFDQLDMGYSMGGGQAVGPIGGTEAPNDQFFLSPNNQLAKWRLVSAGVRISLLNPDEQDDGWWESCTINLSDRTSDWLLSPTRGNRTTLNVPRWIVPYNAVGDNNNINIQNERSYQTGLLREIKNKTFVLKPNVGEHTFIDVLNGKRMESTDSFQLGGNGVIGSGNGSPTVEALIEHCIDRSFSLTYVRLHGRGSDNTFPSRYLVDVKGSYELVYEHGSQLANFHTEPHVDPNLDKTMHAINADPGVAMDTSAS